MHIVNSVGSGMAQSIIRAEDDDYCKHTLRQCICTSLSITSPLVHTIVRMTTVEEGGSISIPRAHADELSSGAPSKAVRAIDLWD